MAGMIYDANQSLNWVMSNPNMKDAFRYSSTNFATSPKIGGNNTGGGTASTVAPDPTAVKKKRSMDGSDHHRSNSLASLFSDEEERALLGIGFFTIWEAGLLVSGYGGTGIVMSRNIVTGSWSGPVAVKVSGMGAGFLAGASVKTIVYLFYDYFTLKSIIGSDGGVIFGVGVGATVGGCTKQTGKRSAYITSPKMLRSAGMGYNIALSRGVSGIFCALSIEGGVCKSRDKLNARFYGKEKLTASDVLLSGLKIQIPDKSAPTPEGFVVDNSDAKRKLKRVIDKLEKLCSKDTSFDFGDDDEDEIEDTNNDNEDDNKPTDSDNKSPPASSKPLSVITTSPSDVEVETHKID